MKQACFFILSLMILACNNRNNQISGTDKNVELNNLFENYFNQRMDLFPLEATANGDNRFNDKLYVDFTDDYHAKLNHFFSSYRDSLKKYDREKLNDNDQVSYDIFKREMEMALEGLQLSMDGVDLDPSFTPFNQFNGLPLELGTMGSGEGNQPFKTVKDYDNWLSRAGIFPNWADSAVDYFKRGMAANFVLPKALVVKMIPQLQAMVVTDPTKSLFYGPIKKMPATFSAADKERLTNLYTS